MTKPPSPEKHYFESRDIQKMQKIAEEKRKKLASEERARLKELHWRRCGNCGMELEEFTFKQETVFKCFNCGAVLLMNESLKKLCGEERRIVESFLELFKF